MLDYKILGVTVYSSVKEIKSSYRRLAKVYHPDNQDTGDENKFKQLSNAYTRIISMAPQPQVQPKTSTQGQPNPHIHIHKFNNKNRIFRVLDPAKFEQTVGFPGPILEDNVVFHFMYDYDQFNLFIDKNIPLPAQLNVTYNNKTLIIKVREEY